MRSHVGNDEIPTWISREAVGKHEVRLRRAVALILPWGHSTSRFKRAGEMCLTGKSAFDRHVYQAGISLSEQLLCSLNAQVDEVLVGRQAGGCTKHAQ
jgi:hypothetical protein